MHAHRGVMITRKVLVEDGVYHVTQRSPGREVLFLEEGDYLRFLALLKETAEKFSLSIFCFALLPNHLHLLLRTAGKNLDRAMKYLFQSYAQGFNKKYQRKGHVFCGVYRASLCADDSYLLAASLYIHLNPYKAGLTSDPFKYRWFSLEPYLSSVKSAFLKPEMVLGVLDSRDFSRARDAYRNLIRESAKLAYDRSPENAGAVKRFREEFMGWFRSSASDRISQDHAAFSSYFELEKKVEEARLRGFTRKPESRKAVIYLIDQLKARGYRDADIAVKLNMSRMTLHRFVKRIKNSRMLQN